MNKTFIFQFLLQDGEGSETWMAMEKNKKNRKEEIRETKYFRG